MKKPLSTRDIAIAAMIAALYTTLCLVLSPFSYGPVQIRAAEAFTLLPVFSPIAIWGVTIGCALSNLIGFMIGANILGFVDVIFGTAATLIAAVLSYRLRGVRIGRVPVFSAIPPVLVNALIIGLELTYMEVNSFNAKVFMLNAVNVGLGQLVACFILGLPLVYLLEKSGVSEKMFGHNTNK